MSENWIPAQYILAAKAFFSVSKEGYANFFWSTDANTIRIEVSY